MTKKFTDEYVLINRIKQYFLHIPNSGKEVIIMLHGGPAIGGSYIAYYHRPYLDFCNVVYYDQRGAGKTRMKNKVKPESISLEVLLEDLKQTIQYVKEKYQTDRVFLVGGSWGSVLGTQYIIRHPNDVKGLIAFGAIVDMAASGKIWYEHLKQTILKTGKKGDIKKINAVDADFPNYPNVSRNDYAKATILLHKLEYKYGYRATDYVKIYRKSPLMTLRDGFQILNAEKFQKNLLEELCDYNIRNIKEYQTPVYYILGRHDEWTSSTVAAEYFETIVAPKKRLYWVENGGHMLDTDNPSAFFGAVKEIISQS